MYAKNIFIDTFTSFPFELFENLSHLLYILVEVCLQSLYYFLVLLQLFQEVIVEVLHLLAPLHPLLHFYVFLLVQGDILNCLSSRVHDCQIAQMIVQVVDVLSLSLVKWRQFQALKRLFLAEHDFKLVLQVDQIRQLQWFKDLDPFRQSVDVVLCGKINFRKRLLLGLLLLWLFRCR